MRAGVPVEGVVRVVTRRPVSRRIEQRVVDVLDSLDPEQLRALERLARAGQPEIVSPGADVPAPHAVARAGADELTLRLGNLLEEIAACLSDLRREQLADRQNRVDDLAVLVDLMTTGWRGVDRRLGRIERTLARLEAAREPPRSIPQPVEGPRPAPEPHAPQVKPPEEPPARDVRPRPARWVSVAATPVLFVGAVAVALMLLDVFASSADDPRLAPATEAGTERRAAPPTALSSTTGGPLPTTPAPATPPVTPGRVFAWPPRAGSDYYLVRFFRGRQLVYEARPREARLILPTTVKLVPGSYRWLVLPGLGAPAENRFGPPLIDSTFVVAR